MHQQWNKKLAVIEGTFLSSAKAGLVAARAWGWGQGSRTQLLKQGCLDAETFHNQAGIGGWPCRGYRALEEVVERPVGKGMGAKEAAVLDLSGPEI